MKIFKTKVIIAAAALCFILPAWAFGRDAGQDFHGQKIRNVTYVKRGSRPLKMSVFIPPGEPQAVPVVLVIHGGAFIGGWRFQMNPLCKAIAEAGMLVFNLEYRLAPRDRYPALVEDTRCALRWIAKNAPRYGGNPQRIGVTGESAGAYLAAMTFLPGPGEFCEQDCPDGAEAVPEIKAAVLYYGVYDMIKLYDYDFPGMHWIYYFAWDKKPADDPEYFREISVTTYLRNSLPPILIQTGTADSLHPESKMLYQTLEDRGEPADIIVYEGAPHGFAVSDRLEPGRVNFENTIRFFKEHLF